jgi:DNA-binding MarR family transcriptional regulator
MRTDSGLGAAAQDVLAVLRAADSPLDGPSVARAAHRRPSTVYPVMADLEARGLVSSQWAAEPAKPADGRRRVYELTPVGGDLAPRILAGHALRPDGTPPPRRRAAVTFLRGLPRLVTALR